MPETEVSDPALAADVRPVVVAARVSLAPAFADLVLPQMMSAHAGDSGSGVDGLLGLAHIDPSEVENTDPALPKPALIDRMFAVSGSPTRPFPEGFEHPLLTPSQQWAALRDCESGGNYRAVNATGKYRGAYQFDQHTWESVGGIGDPAKASPAEQDARARALFEERGAAPWPYCGRYLG